jgi:hypothetical protein
VEKFETYVLQIKYMKTVLNVGEPRQRSRYCYSLRAGRSRIESRWRRDFPYLSRPSLKPTQPPIQ